MANIVSVTTDVAGQTGNFIGGVVPRRVKMVVTDNLSTVTTAGYLTPELLGGYALYPTDIIDMWYGYVSATNPGTYAAFTLSFSNSVITLVQNVSPGNVLLPVTASDIPIFNGTTGQIKDSNVAFSNATDTVAPLFHGTATAGDLVSVNNSNKTIQDSGVTVASVSAALIQLGTLQQASVTLNQAAVQGMYAAPFQIVAAPGAGLVAVPIYMALYTNFQTAAFASGGVAILQWGNTVHGAGTNSLAATIPAAEITAAASQIYSLAGSTASALTGITNAGLFLSNQTGAFTSGNAASTVVVNVTYMIITATV